MKAQNSLSVEIIPLGEPNGLGKGPIKLNRQADGTWTILTEPAEPMIVVMENGMNVDYPDLLLNYSMPEIETKFRCLTGKNNCAVAGLSMGAGQAEQTVLQNPEKFGYLECLAEPVNPI